METEGINRRCELADRVVFKLNTQEWEEFNKLLERPLSSEEKLKNLAGNMSENFGWSE